MGSKFFTRFRELVKMVWHLEVIKGIEQPPWVPYVSCRSTNSSDAVFFCWLKELRKKKGIPSISGNATLTAFMHQLLSKVWQLQWLIQMFWLHDTSLRDICQHLYNWVPHSVFHLLIFFHRVDTILLLVLSLPATGRKSTNEHTIQALNLSPAPNYCKLELLIRIKENNVLWIFFSLEKKMREWNYFLSIFRDS